MSEIEERSKCHLSPADDCPNLVEDQDEGRQALELRSSTEAKGHTIQPEIWKVNVAVPPHLGAQLHVVQLYSCRMAKSLIPIILDHEFDPSRAKNSESSSSPTELHADRGERSIGSVSSGAARRKQQSSSYQCRKRSPGSLVMLLRTAHALKPVRPLSALRAAAQP